MSGVGRDPFGAPGELLPAVVGSAEVGPDDPLTDLYRIEEVVVNGGGSGRAVSPGRDRDFRAGRHCARLALREIGHGGVAVPVGPGGVPQWPADVVGSITHSRGRAGAAAAGLGVLVHVGSAGAPRRLLGLGIDMEGGTISERAVRRVLRPTELQSVATLGRGRPGVRSWATVLFSAKESFYKAWWPAVGVRLGFQDVEVALHPSVGETAGIGGSSASGEGAGSDRLAGSFSVTIRRMFQVAVPAADCFGGRFEMEGGWVRTAVLLTAPG